MATTTAATSTTPLSVDELLARAKERAAVKSSTGPKSTVQQMLEGRDPVDTVQLSPVQKLVKAQSAVAKKESYFDSDDYLRAKIGQLKIQISIYSQLPGLDASGSIMDSLSREVTEIVGKQQAKIKASQDEAAKKQAELAAKEDPFKNLMTPDQLLKRASNASKGVANETAVSAAVQKLLDSSRGKVVDANA